jgi:uncharacterized membrane protein YbhN (UPF0104 family)
MAPRGGRLRKLPWRPLVGVACGALAFWVASAGVSRAELAASLHDVAVLPLAAAVAGACVLLALQAARWWIFVRPVYPLRYRHALSAMALGYLFNVLLPGRAGDLVRVHYLGRRTGVSRATLLGTGIVDLWADKLGWVAAFPVLCLGGAPPAWLARVVLVVSAAVAATGAVLALLARSASRRAADAAPATRPSWVANLRAGLASSGWRRVGWAGLCVAPLPWIWETLVIQVAGHAVGIRLGTMEAFAVLTAFNAATIVPSPANAGTFEAGVTAALVALGVTRPAALAFALVYHLSQVIPSALLGAGVLAVSGEHLGGPSGLLRRDAR